MKPPLEQRVAELEKITKSLKKALASVNRKIDNKSRMTVTEMARKGGSTPTDKPKGMAAISPERRAEILRKARAAKAAKRGSR